MTRTRPRFLGVDDVERAATLEARWVPLDGLDALGEPVLPAPDAIAEVVERWRRTRDGQSRPPA